MQLEEGKPKINSLYFVTLMQLEEGISIGRGILGNGDALKVLYYASSKTPFWL